MCECGCTANDERYLFPAPGKQVYMLTISGGCTECDAGPGITIERLPKSDLHYKEWETYTEGYLNFEKWPDSEGVALITGFRKHEFVEALLPSLVGVEVPMDDIGAEIVLEEAYVDSIVRPHFPRKESSSVQDD